MTWTILQCSLHVLKPNLQPTRTVQMSCPRVSLRTPSRRKTTRFRRPGCQDLDCDSLARTSSVRMRRVKVLWSCFLLLIPSQMVRPPTLTRRHRWAHIPRWLRLVYEKKVQRSPSFISRARARMRRYTLYSMSILPTCLRRGAGLSRGRQREDTNLGGMHGSLHTIGDASDVYCDVCCVVMVDV